MSLLKFIQGSAILLIEIVDALVLLRFVLEIMETQFI